MTKKLLLIISATLVLLSSNILTAIDIGFGARIKNYTNKFMTVGIENGFKTVDIESGKEEFVRSKSGGPRYIFWNVRDNKNSKQEEAYRTPIQYNHPHYMIILDNGKKYKMTEKQGLGKPIEHKEEAAFDIKAQGIKGTGVKPTPTTSQQAKPAPQKIKVQPAKLAPTQTQPAKPIVVGSKEQLLQDLEYIKKNLKNPAGMPEEIEKMKKKALNIFQEEYKKMRQNPTGKDKDRTDAILRIIKEIEKNQEIDLESIDFNLAINYYGQLANVNALTAVGDLNQKLYALEDIKFNKKRIEEIENELKKFK